MVVDTPDLDDLADEATLESGSRKGSYTDEKFREIDGSQPPASRILCLNASYN
jgi:hypothetical protein